MGKIYVLYEITDNIAVVTTEVTNLNIVGDALRSRFVEVEDIPFVPNQLGKNSRKCLNLDTSTLFYDYVDRALTPEEKIEQLETELTVSKEDNISNMLAITELYEMILGGGA